MIKKAYIHEYGNGKMEEEHSQVKTVLEQRGIEVQLFTSKRLQRNQLQFDKNTLVIGNHPTIQTTFKRTKYSGPLTECYPLSLRNFLKRQIRESTVGRLLNQSRTQVIESLFVKPKSNSKAFTGFIIESNEQLIELESFSKSLELYCSELVEWQSEYRVFVNKGVIQGIQHYEGNPDISIDLEVVEKAIQKFEESTERTNGYGIDFGVLKNGETALVEWNDGFALGAYGLDKELYTDLLISRWMEINDVCFVN